MNSYISTEENLNEEEDEFIESKYRKCSLSDCFFYILHSAAHFPCMVISHLSILGSPWFHVCPVCVLSISSSFFHLLTLKDLPYLL